MVMLVAKRIELFSRLRNWHVRPPSNRSQVRLQLETSQLPSKGDPPNGSTSKSKPSTNFRREHLHKIKLGIGSFRRPREQEANELDGAQHQVWPSLENRMIGPIASKSKKCKLLAAVLGTLLIVTAGNILS